MIRDKYRLNDKEASLIINLANNFNIDINDVNQAEKLIQMYVYTKIFMRQELLNGVNICRRCGAVRQDNIESDICRTCADDLRNR